MDDNAWDSICVNPHETYVEEGRRQGHDAGLDKGYNDGLDLGSTQGVAFGIEIGFLRKSCQMLLLSTADADAAPRSSVQSKIQELLVCLDAVTRLDNQFGDEVDLQNEMQRIRAKFKVITTQLKMQHYSLKKILTGNVTAPAKQSTEW